MSGYFSAEMVTELERRRDEVQRQYRALQGRFIGRQYRSERAREYATQGFCRRLDVLARSVNFVFNILPPAEDDLPDNDDVVAATMFIQSFVINVAGCLDNLAWVWVYETDLKDKDGHELDRRMVGLGKSYRLVRNSLPLSMRQHLNSRKEWLIHVAEFRDSLAHRIPLYIPPYIIAEDRAAEHAQLSKDALVAAQHGDFTVYHKLMTDQKALGRFRPWMTHSVTEQSPRVVFHAQMLQDYAAVEEFGSKILDALAEFNQSRSSETENKYRRWLNWRTGAGVIALFLAIVLF